MHSTKCANGARGPGEALRVEKVGHRAGRVVIQPVREASDQVGEGAELLGICSDSLLDYGLQENDIGISRGLFVQNFCSANLCSSGVRLCKLTIGHENPTSR